MSQKDKVQWRRNKVQELLVKGYNYYEIASTLKISRPPIPRDILYISLCAKQNIRKYIEKDCQKCANVMTYKNINLDSGLPIHTPLDYHT